MNMLGNLIRLLLLTWLMPSNLFLKFYLLYYLIYVRELVVFGHSG